MAPNRSQIKVAGMSCDHCVAAVTQELTALHGVIDVDVDLATGVVTYESTRPLEPEALEEAIDAAGFELAGQ